MSEQTVEEYLTQVCEEQIARLTKATEANIQAFKDAAQQVRKTFEDLPEDAPASPSGPTEVEAAKEDENTSPSPVSRPTRRSRRTRA